jgi:hypothetical protein
MYKNMDFQEMRILPMRMPAELEGHSIDEVQHDYFLKDLVDHNGEYICQHEYMNVHGKVLILFQYSNAIVASAVLEEAVEESAKETSCGKYCFNTDSIAIFNPISSEEMKKMFRLSKLSEGNQRLELSKKDNLLGILAKKGITYRHFKMT